MATVRPPTAIVRPNSMRHRPRSKTASTLYLQVCGVGRTEIRIEEFYYDHPIQHYRAIRVEQADLVGDHRAMATVAASRQRVRFPRVHPDDDRCGLFPF